LIYQPGGIKNDCSLASKSFVVLSIIPKKTFLITKTLKLNFKNIPFTDKIHLVPPPDAV